MITERGSLQVHHSTILCSPFRVSVAIAMLEMELGLAQARRRL